MHLRVLVGKKRGLFDGVDRLLDSIEETFKVEEREKVITESQQTTTTAKGVLRQTMRGKGYEIGVRKSKGKSPQITILSEVPLSVTINGEVVWSTEKPVD